MQSFVLLDQKGKQPKMAKREPLLRDVFGEDMDISTWAPLKNELPPQKKSAPVVADFGVVTRNMARSSRKELCAKIRIGEHCQLVGNGQRSIGI